MLVSIFTKLSVHENKTNVIMSKLEKCMSDNVNLRKENSQHKTRIDFSTKNHHNHRSVTVM